MVQSSQDVVPSFKHYVFAFFASFALWLLLVGNLHADELLAGAAVGLVVTLVAGRRLSILSGVKFNLTASVHLVRYLAYFLKALILANLDMARRVLSPSLPLRPAVVEVETGLQSSLGKLLLANSITLTPGTLSVDVQNEHILVHWVDCPPGTDLTRATRTIAESFERHISGFLQ